MYKQFFFYRFLPFIYTLCINNFFLWITSLYLYLNILLTITSPYLHFMYKHCVDWLLPIIYTLCTNILLTDYFPLSTLYVQTFCWLITSPYLQFMYKQFFFTDFFPLSIIYVQTIVFDGLLPLIYTLCTNILLTDYFPLSTL